jgi:hypothetical protein
MGLVVVGAGRGAGGFVGAGRGAGAVVVRWWVGGGVAGALGAVEPEWLTAGGVGLPVPDVGWGWWTVQPVAIAASSASPAADRVRVDVRYVIMLAAFCGVVWCPQLLRRAGLHITCLLDSLWLAACRTRRRVMVNRLRVCPEGQREPWPCRRATTPARGLEFLMLSW